MVLLRRLDYGFNGYQVPPMPRATRSARRRRCFKKGSEDNQICPFDLLAIVAGNLLLERDGNPNSGDISTNKDQCAVAGDDVKKEWEDEGKLWKIEANDCENPARNFFVSELVSQVHAQISSPKENDKKLGLASPIRNSDCMERVNVEKLVNSRRKDDMGTPNGNVKVAFSSYMECGDCKLKGQTMRLIKDEPHRPAKVLNNSESFMCSYDPVFCNKKPAPVSLHSSAKGPLHGNNIIPNTSCPVIQDNVNVVSRDDDDNSSGCTHTSTKKKFLRSAPRIGDRRIRKILASKYWKVAPKLKDAILSKIDGDWRSAYCNRKNSYKYQRSEKLYPLKKRKHFGGYNSLSYSDGGISSESFLDSPQQGNSGDASGPFQKMHRATGPSVVGQKAPFQPRDSHVKLRIKSFRVPELFIEIPESGTIGSLKVY
uniref:Telomere repeat-binding protein 1-6-like ubiquitin-like domain-containing protein n=1 Tax=Rhizophora mucronata TaxID=61149 RepID=A0A2P2KXY6_RHIMU